MNTKTETERADTFTQDLRAIGLGALALVSFGHSFEYELPRLNKPVDVPGLSAIVEPRFVHNSGYDFHLAGAELVINAQGNYLVTLTHNGRALDSTSFSVKNGEPSTVQLAGTPRGGAMHNFAGGFGWANGPGEFNLTIVRTVEGREASHAVQF